MSDKAINCNCKVPGIRVIIILKFRSTIHHTGMLSGDVSRLPACLLPHAGLAFSYQRVHWINVSYDMILISAGRVPSFKSYTLAFA